MATSMIENLTILRVFEGPKKIIDFLEIEKTFENKKSCQLWINGQISIFIEF